MKRKGFIFVVVLALLVGGGLFYAYQNIGAIVQNILNKEVPGLKFQRLDIALGKVSVAGVEYARGKKARITTDNISISPSLWSLFGDTFEVADINIEKPTLTARKQAGKAGLELPVPTIEKAPQTATNEKAQNSRKDTEKSPGRSIHIAKFRLKGGKGEFLDESVNGEPAHFTFTDINIAAENIYAPSRAGRMPLAISLNVPAKRPGSLSLSGNIDRTDRSGDLKLVVSALYLPLLTPYYSDPQVTLQLTDGVFSADTMVVMEKGKYKITGFVQLADIKVNGGQFYGIDAARIQEYLEKHPEPIKVDLDLQGNLDEPGSMRRSLVGTIVKALLKRIGGGKLEDAKRKLQEGDVEGAKQELKDLKRELKDLFKRR